MNEKGKNITGIVVFWLAATVPFIGVFLVKDLYGAKWFAISLMIYAAIYRPILHIFRLMSLKVIEKKDAWKFFIPFYQTKYFKTLWLG